MAGFLGAGAGCACAQEIAGSAKRARTAVRRLLCDCDEMRTQFLRDKEDTAWRRRRQLLGPVFGKRERRKEHVRMWIRGTNKKRN
jgi:hypothetical protein